MFPYSGEGVWPIHGYAFSDANDILACAKRAPRLHWRSALIDCGTRRVYGASVRMYLATANISSGFSASLSGFMFLPLPFMSTCTI